MNKLPRCAVFARLPESWSCRRLTGRDRHRAAVFGFGLLMVVGMMMLAARPAAAQGMSMGMDMAMRGEWAPVVGHLSRSLAHGIGIFGGVAIIAFSFAVRYGMRGSPLATCSLLVGVGTALFVLVFLDMEVGHISGSGLWSLNIPIAIAQLWWMSALAAMIALYALSYRELVTTIGGSSMGRRGRGPSAAGPISVIAGFGVLGIVGTVGGESQDEAVWLHEARSVAHILGLVFSLLLAYYANRARNRFSGGVYSVSAGYTLAGAVLFAVAFSAVSLRHDFGIDLFAPLGGMQLKMAMSMVLFTGTVFAFGWAYFLLVRAVRGT